MAARRASPGTEPKRAARRRRGSAGARALEVLAPLCRALASAEEQAPVAVARRLQRAIAGTLGWSVTFVPSPAPLSDDEQPFTSGDATVVPVAPGAGALRIEGGDAAARQRVAALGALALARSRAHPDGPTRRGEAAGPPRRRAAGPGGGRRRGAGAWRSPASSSPPTGPAGLRRRGGGPPGTRRRRWTPCWSTSPTARPPWPRWPGSAPPACPISGAMILGTPGDEATRLRALELGADFMASPWSGPELLARLDRAIRLGRANRALQDQALTDPLTGLANRRALRARLAEELRRVRRYRTTLTCLLADVDRLKAINDDLGHAAGRPGAPGGRHRAAGRAARDRLRGPGRRRRVRRPAAPHLAPPGGGPGRAAPAAPPPAPVGPPGAARRLEASFGVAQLGPRADGDAMIEAADRALYAAKQAGRATVRRAR